MLRPRITPCLLIRNGGLVKTQQFSNDKYVGDPINAVKIFNEKGVDELMIFDIDATAKQHIPNFELIRNIAVESRMPLCYGGGITDAEQAVRIISLGFEKISISAGALERTSSRDMGGVYKLKRKYARNSSRAHATAVHAYSDGTLQSTVLHL